jgi:hypothetical protein
LSMFIPLKIQTPPKPLNRLKFLAGARRALQRPAREG